MDATLKDLILTRLDAEAADAAWVWHVIAACDGLDALEKELGGIGSRPKRERAEAATAEPPEPPGAYLRSITVEGFRGIGQTSTLTLKSGPGLTLVVARNGSGKSSFAGALEFLLAGRNRRSTSSPRWRSSTTGPGRATCFRS